MKLAFSYPGKSIKNMNQNVAFKWTILIWRSWVDLRKEKCVPKQKNSSTIQIPGKDYPVMGNFKWNNLNIQVNCKEI